MEHNASFLGLTFSIRHIPELDKGFIPLSLLLSAYEKTAAKSGGAILGLAAERPGAGPAALSAMNFTFEPDGKLSEAGRYIGERLAKSMLWAYGGNKIIVGGSVQLCEHLEALYKKGGAREFDAEFMSMVYEKPFEVENVSYDKFPQGPAESVKATRISGGAPNVNGCRIGFDAGGSDIKVSAVIDGKAVFSEEITWLPKINENPEYHYEHILAAMKLAASKMPRVDAIGVSSAGIYVDNKTMVASLFLKVPKKEFDAHIKDIYIRAAREIGAVPLVVANDGDVTALAGAMEFNDANVLGIAMGTSQAGGYIDARGRITGRLNELAFVPVDANPNAMADEWSGDIGCGVKYFSQDGVIKLAAVAGIHLDESLTPAEKLSFIQELLIKGDERAARIYESIGVYLGYAIGYYDRFYAPKHLLLLGRVMSGEGGSIVFSKSKDVLRDEFPEISERLALHLPDEKSRRVGQSVAAASLPVF